MRPAHYPMVGEALLWTSGARARRHLDSGRRGRPGATPTASSPTFMIEHGRATSECDGRPYRSGRSPGDPPCPATSPPNRSAISKASSPACRSRARRAGGGAPARGGAVRSRRRASAGAGPHRRSRRQAQRPGEVQARAASVRRLCPAEGAGREERSRRSRRTISAGAITACSTSRRRRSSYMCRLRIPNGILKHWQFAGLADLAEQLRRRLRARHHARQPADPRDRAEERGRHARRRSRTSACARAAPAPTTSATSPARRPPASIRRS